jgi:hypothetical protein
MSKSVGSGTDKVLRQWGASKERQEVSSEIAKFFKDSLRRQKAATRKSKTKSTRGKRK